MIKFKRGKLGSWNSQNPTLDDGQPGVIRMDDGNYALKVGDGSLTFASLPYLSALPLVQTLSGINWDNLKSSGTYMVTSGTQGTPPHISIFHAVC